MGLCWVVLGGVAVLGRGVVWCVVLGCVVVWLVGAWRGVGCCVGLCWAGVAGWGVAWC